MGQFLNASDSADGRRLAMAILLHLSMTVYSCGANAIPFLNPRSPHRQISQPLFHRLNIRAANREPCVSCRSACIGLLRLYTMLPAATAEPKTWVGSVSKHDSPAVGFQCLNYRTALDVPRSRINRGAACVGKILPGSAVAVDRQGKFGARNGPLGLDHGFAIKTECVKRGRLMVLTQSSSRALTTR